MTIPTQFFYEGISSPNLEDHLGIVTDAGVGGKGCYTRRIASYHGRSPCGECVREGRGHPAAAGGRGPLGSRVLRLQLCITTDM